MSTLTVEKKWLRNKNNKTIHAWTPQLEKLGYMEPYDEVEEDVVSPPKPKYLIDSRNGNIIEGYIRLAEEDVEFFTVYIPPKMLIQAETGRLFAWTYILSRRPDMMPYEESIVKEKKSVMPIAEVNDEEEALIPMPFYGGKKGDDLLNDPNIAYEVVESGAETIENIRVTEAEPIKFKRGKRAIE